MIGKDKDRAAFEAWAKSMRFSDWDETFEECWLAGLAHGRAESPLRAVHPDDVEEWAEGIAIDSESELLPAVKRDGAFRNPSAEEFGPFVDIVAFFPCDVSAILAARPEKGEPHRTLPDMIDEERSEGRDDWRASEEEIARLARQTDDRSAMRVYDARHCVRWAEDRAASVIEGLRGEVQRVQAAVGSSHVAEQDALNNLVDEIHIREEWQEKAKAAEKRAEEAEATASCRDATLAMAVARLGGQVEGKPTQRSNFLQRIDALREAEAERDELRKWRAAWEDAWSDHHELDPMFDHYAKKHGLSAEPSKPHEPAVELAAGQVWVDASDEQHVITVAKPEEDYYLCYCHGGEFQLSEGNILNLRNGCRLVAGPGSRAEEVNP